MSKWFKKIKFIILTMVIVAGIGAFSPMVVTATEMKTEDNVSWEIQGTTLIISGTGNMEDYELINIGQAEDSNSPWNNANIEKVIIEEGITGIGNYAFYWCENVKEIILPESLTHIGMRAFDGCTSLEKIKIPEGVTSIGVNTFRDCVSLSEIILPSTLESIGDVVFAGCWSLTSIDIPEGVTSIGRDAFLYCDSLKTINLPQSLETIGDGAFASCVELVNIQLPNNLKTIGIGLFMQDMSLTEIYLPECITTINNQMFSECFGLVNIEIPKHVTTIERYAFHYAKNLKSIILHENVTNIHEEAFDLCEELSTIYGVKGSYAETFAIENGYMFVELQTEDSEVEDDELNNDNTENEEIDGETGNDNTENEESDNQTNNDNINNGENNSETDDKVDNNQTDKNEVQINTYYISEKETAISKQDFLNILKENKNKDIVVKLDDEITFTFKKNTMKEVVGLEKYDFGTKVINKIDENMNNIKNLTQENFVKRINFAYSGKLPATAWIKFYVGTDMEGKTLYYSRINEDMSVTYIQSVIVDEKGYIIVKQDRCSDYVVTIERIDSNGEKEESPKTGNTNNATLLLGISAIVCLIFLRKKQNSF